MPKRDGGGPAFARVLVVRGGGQGSHVMRAHVSGGAHAWLREAWLRGACYREGFAG